MLLTNLLASLGQVSHVVQCRICNQIQDAADRQSFMFGPPCP